MAPCDCGAGLAASTTAPISTPGQYPDPVTTEGVQGWHATALHFEAMAAGAVVLTERALVPHMASLGFVEGVHYLACEATPDDVVAAVQLLHSADPVVDAQLESIAAAGQALVMRRYRTAHSNRALRAAIASMVARGHGHRDQQVPAGGGGPAGAATPASHAGVSTPSPVPFVPSRGWRSATARHTGPDSDVVDGVVELRAAKDVILRTG